MVLWHSTQVMRTIDSVGSLFQPLENVIHQHFIPALTGQDPCSGLEWELLALPCRLGGLNILVNFNFLHLKESVLHWLH